MVALGAAASVSTRTPYLAPPDLSASRNMAAYELSRSPRRSCEPSLAALGSPGRSWRRTVLRNRYHVEVHPDRVYAVRGRWRTPVNAGQHCWKACWGQPLRSSNPLSSATLTCDDTLGSRSRGVPDR